MECCTILIQLGRGWARRTSYLLRLLALVTLLLSACSMPQAAVVPRVVGAFTWTVLDRGTADYVHWRGDPEPADSSAELKTVWDEEYLYFGVRVYDDVLVSDSADVWRDDSVEIGIDGLNDGIGWRGDDHQFTFTVDGRVTDYGQLVPGVIAATAPFSRGWGLEVMIPVEVLGAGQLVEGKRVGFTFGLHDDDDGGDWDSYMIWESDSTNDSEGYGVIVLSVRPVTPTPTGSATPTVTPSVTSTATPSVAATLAVTPTGIAGVTLTVTLTPSCPATPVVTPEVLWLCRPVTVTPAP